MKLKKLIAVVLALVLAFALCSCGKMTAERLVADMAKAIAGAKSFAGTMDMTMDMSLSIMGQSMDMTAAMDTEVAYSDNISYSKGTMKTSMSGVADMSAETEIEVYSVINGETVTAYSLTEGVWAKMEMPKMEMNTNFETVLMLIKPENLGDIVLQEELDTYNGKEVYVLTISDCNYPELAQEYINSQLGSVFGDIDISEIDLSGIVMQVTLKVYKDTKLPAVLTIDFGDSMTSVMEEVTNSLLDAMTGSLSDVEKALLGQIELKIEIPSVVTTVTFDEYNIAPIVIPEEALDAKEIATDGSGIFGSILG